MLKLCYVGVNILVPKFRLAPLSLFMDFYNNFVNLLYLNNDVRMIESIRLSDTILIKVSELNALRNIKLKA